MGTYMQCNLEYLEMASFINPVCQIDKEKYTSNLRRVKLFWELIINPICIPPALAL